MMHTRNNAYTETVMIESLGFNYSYTQRLETWSNYTTSHNRNPLL